jgi:hypothetical protein
MAIPRAYSYTWSDADGEGAAQATLQTAAPDDPLELRDKELHLWVAYPETKKKAKRQQKASKSGSRKRKLWAVVIIESLERLDDFTYEVTLRKIFKTDERSIKIWVRNDPADQSEEATVFGVVSPRNENLPPLEQQLTMWAAKRVYEAIAETWPDDCAEPPPETISATLTQRHPK